MSVAWVGLGSNLDDPMQHMRAGIEALRSMPGVTLRAVSGLYRSPPWGYAAQPAFLNAVARLDTELSPEDLLQALQTVETARGRRRDGPRWGPRTLDLDLLLHDQRQMDVPGLTLPHSRMAQRAFVLRPLAELAPDLVIPGQGSVADLLARLDDADCVRVAPAGAWLLPGTVS